MTAAQALRGVVAEELRPAAAEWAALRSTGTVTYAPALDRLFEAIDSALREADAAPPVGEQPCRAGCGQPWSGTFGEDGICGYCLPDNRHLLRVPRPVVVPGSRP